MGQIPIQNVEIGSVSKRACIRKFVISIADLPIHSVR